LRSGFSNSSKVGRIPKAPQEASKNKRTMDKVPLKIVIQNHFIYLEKSVFFAVAFFAII